MAVAATVGDPEAAAQQAIGQAFKVGALRSRWPDLPGTPREQWRGFWGLPVPEGTASVPQKAPGVKVGIEVWEYGTMAEILHLGPYDQEPATIERLRQLVAEQGYEIAGAHEEQYLSSPRAKAPKTLIRFPVRKRQA
jgi:hypothetical protein